MILLAAWIVSPGQAPFNPGQLSNCTISHVATLLRFGLRLAPQIADDRRGNLILCGLGTSGAFVLSPLGSAQAHVIVSSESSLPLPERDRAGTASPLDGKS